MIREAKIKANYKQTIEISENKIKTMWNIINRVTRGAEKSSQLPHSLIMNNKKVSIVNKTVSK